MKTKKKRGSKTSKRVGIFETMQQKVVSNCVELLQYNKLVWKLNPVEITKQKNS